MNKILTYISGGHFTGNTDFAIHIPSEDQKMLLKFNQNELKKIIEGEVGGNWGTLLVSRRGVQCLGSQKNKSKCKIICC